MSHFKSVLAALPILFFSGLVEAGNITDVIADLAEKGHIANREKAKSDAAEVRVNETWRKAWMPQMDAQYTQGYQKYTKPNPATNHPGYDARNGSIKVTQQVYDFGKSAAQVEEADRTAQQARYQTEAVVQGVVQSAFETYLSVQKAQDVLELLKKSEANIMKQAELEDARVVAGRGYPSNVLQAKVQLMRVSAQRVSAEAALDVARAKVDGLFGEFASMVDYKDKVSLDQSDVPNSVDEAKKVALDNNRQVLIGRMRSMALGERINSTMSREFLPKIQIVGEGKTTVNSDGTDGYVRDRKIQLQAVYPLNLGLSGLSSVEAARKDMQSSVSDELSTKDGVLEQVFTAWRNLESARTNIDINNNQVNIAIEFLDIARKEREAGKRDLLDVLTAETDLIKGQIDLVTAEYDSLIAASKLLLAVGKITPAHIKVVGARTSALEGLDSSITRKEVALAKQPPQDVVQVAPVVEKQDAAPVAVQEEASASGMAVSQSVIGSTEPTRAAKQSFAMKARKSRNAVDIAEAE